MTEVFIGGSRGITRLEAGVRRRLDRIVETGLPVVIGDANGADKAVQRYLNDRHFEKVEVFSADESPRNNAGGWPMAQWRAKRARADSFAARVAGQSRVFVIGSDGDLG